VGWFSALISMICIPIGVIYTIKQSKGTLIEVSIPIQFFLRSWDHASLMYSSITNQMQRYTMVFITISALHLSDCSSVHHQDLKTVYTASGICRAFSASYRYCE
jgi:hypothetical protein